MGPTVFVSVAILLLFAGPLLLSLLSARGSIDAWEKRQALRERQRMKPYQLTDIEWGRAWEVGLDDATKKDLNRAVWRGQRAPHRQLPAIAAERARRLARVVRFGMWFTSVEGIAEIVVAPVTGRPPAVAFVAVWFALSVLAWLALRRLERAERLNAELAKRDNGRGART